MRGLTLEIKEIHTENLIFQINMHIADDAGKQIPENEQRVFLNESVAVSW